MSPTSSSQLAQWISLADHSIEEAGLAGKLFSTAEEASAWITPIAAELDLCSSFVGNRRVMKVAITKHMPAYGAPDGTHGTTTSTGSIVVSPEHADKLTILHELAHLRARAEGHTGHGPVFALFAYELYRDHLSAEAGEVLSDVLELPLGYKLANSPPFQRTTELDL